MVGWGTRFPTDMIRRLPWRGGSLDTYRVVPVGAWSPSRAAGAAQSQSRLHNPTGSLVPVCSLCVAPQRDDPNSRLAVFSFTHPAFHLFIHPLNMSDPPSPSFSSPRSPLSFIQVPVSWALDICVDNSFPLILTRNLQGKRRYSLLLITKPRLGKITGWG